MIIQIILFVVACFAWQAAKDSMRAKKEPKTKSTRCGCEIAPREPYARRARVTKPCEAHRIIFSLGGQ